MAEPLSTHKKAYDRRTDHEVQAGTNKDKIQQELMPVLHLTRRHRRRIVMHKNDSRCFFTRQRMVDGLEEHFSSLKNSSWE